jgi:hypothetical protein
MRAIRDPSLSPLPARLRVAALLVPIAVVTACGGGSSGGSSPPPPPASSPPSVTFDITEITVLSGGTFSTTVGATADDHGTNAITLTCTNGVQLTTTGGTVDFTVPEASDVVHATCTAGVTDSKGRSASQSLSITILPKTNIGQVVGIFNPALKLVLPPSAGQHVTAIAPAPGLAGRYRVAAIKGPTEYYRDDVVLVSGDYASIDFLQSPSLFAHGLPDAAMSIASASENKIYWLVQEPQSQDFAVRETIDVQSPCFVAQTDTYWANDMVVGQRDHGLTVFDVDTGSDVMNAESFNATPVFNVGAGRSLCHMIRGVVPESVSSQYPGFRSSPPSGANYAGPLTAIDYKTNELVFYGDIDANNVLDEMGTMPIETHATGHLNIVQVISRGGPTQIPRYLLVLLSDGEPTGEHRLVEIDFDPQTNNISQRIVHEWSDGVPVSMLQGQLGGSTVGGSFRFDLVVVLGTTQNSFFFDDLLPLEAGFGEPPLYGAPLLFDVGVGAGSAVAALSPYGPKAGVPDFGVLVSYPDSGRVIYISLPITN